MLEHYWKLTNIFRSICREHSVFADYSEDGEVPPIACLRLMRLPHVIGSRCTLAATASFATTASLATNAALAAITAFITGVQRSFE